MELAAGGESFGALAMKKRITMRALIWQSSYLAIAYSKGLYHVAISGSSASVVGRTNVKNGRPLPWIQSGDVLLAPYGVRAKELGFWEYPQGGKAVKILSQVGKHFSDINSIVVSSASDR
jgi:hypothetical protein